MDYVIAVDRRQRKRQAVHQRLLDTAEELFRERGVTRTTIEEIAEAADVARQTVFNHFPHKEALVVELAADGMQSVAERVQSLLECGVPALDVMQRAAEWVLDTAMQDGELSTIAARELLHPDRERALRAAQQFPLAKVFEAILLQAREEDAIRTDLPLNVVASRICAVLRSIVAERPGSTIDELHEDLSICFDIVFNGIRDRRR